MFADNVMNVNREKLQKINNTILIYGDGCRATLEKPGIEVGSFKEIIKHINLKTMSGSRVIIWSLILGSKTIAGFNIDGNVIINAEKSLEKMFFNGAGRSRQD